MNLDTSSIYTYETWWHFEEDKESAFSKVLNPPHLKDSDFTLIKVKFFNRGTQRRVKGYYYAKLS